jgi:hypothetical protein
MEMSSTMTMGEGCGKFVHEAELGGMSLSKNVGKKDETKMKTVVIRTVSMPQAMARSQNPANAGRGGKTGISGMAGIISGGGTFCGTETGPICATVRGVSHCGQKLAPSGISAPHFSQVRMAILRGKPQET